MSNVTRVAPLNSSIVQGFISPSALGASIVVAAVTGMRIRVISLALVTTAVNSVKFQSNAVDISALWPLGANGGLVLPFNEHGWMTTAVGEALNVNLSVATATGVHITYQVL